MNLRTFSKLLLSSALVFGIERFCHKRTDGFTIQKIALHEDPKLSLSKTEPNDRVKAALGQPYHFLASGGESYAFISQDGEWILKFFKNHHMTEMSWADSLPTPFLTVKKQAFLKKRRFRTKRFWQSCQIAANDMKEESQTLYFQIEPSSAIKLTIFDKIGVRHDLNLKDIPFALQKKAAIFLPLLEKDIALKNYEEAQHKIRLAIEASCQMLDKGIRNCDPAFHRNVGWENGKIVFFDMGSFEKIKKPLSTEEYRNEVLYITKHLGRFLKVQDEDLWQFYHKSIENLLQKERSNPL